MEFNDVLSLYFERSNALQMYWNFYITIILALTAFFGTVKLSPRIKYSPAILIVAFIGFAVVNLGALREVEQQRIDAKDLIEKGAFKKESAPDEATVKAMSEHLNPPSISGITTVHLLGDIFTIGAILTLVLSERKPTKT